MRFFKKIYPFARVLWFPPTQLFVVSIVLHTGVSSRSGFFGIWTLGCSTPKLPNIMAGFYAIIISEPFFIASVMLLRTRKWVVMNAVTRHNDGPWENTLYPRFEIASVSRSEAGTLCDSLITARFCRGNVRAVPLNFSNSSSTYRNRMSI